MKTHTKGPWRIIDREVLEDGSIYPAHIVGENDIEVVHIETNTIIKLSQEYPGGIWGDNSKRDANAKLIAAAPELLESLKRCMARLDYLFEVNDFEVAYGETAAAANEARQIIAKAEGAQ